MNNRNLVMIVLLVVAGSTTVDVATAAITDNLLFYLPLDSNALDQSGNGVATVINNSVSFSDAGIVGNSAGIFNSAGVDTNTANYITTTNELSLGTSDFSVAVWVNGGDDFSVNRGDGTIVSNKDWDSGGNVGWVVSRGGNGGWQWNFTSNASGRNDFDPPDADSFLEDNQWHHIAVTHDRDGNAIFYDDGAQIGTVDISAHVAGSIDAGLPTGIGTDGAKGDPWDAFINGLVDEVAIWDRVLTGAEIQAIYDGALSGRAIPNVRDPLRLTLTIDRETTEISLVNNTSSSLPIRGYSILSDAGALDASNWDSISDNADADSGGAIDSDDRWVKFTAAGAHGDLSEGSLGEGTLSRGESYSLGTGTWIPFYREDLQFEYIDGNGDIITSGFIEYSGNDDAAFPLGDLDFNGAVNRDDWVIYADGLGRDFVDLTIAQSYAQGDLNGDLVNDYVDFRAFKSAFDAVNGPGAFAAMVPEPGSLLLLLAGVGLVVASQRRRSGPRSTPIALTLLAVLVLCNADGQLAQAQSLLFEEDFESLAGSLGPFISATETGGDGTDWTPDPPAGWLVDNSRMSPDGVPEFEGWTFMDYNAWNTTAEDQNRSQFELAEGVVAVADPDEWDDAPGTQLVFNSFLSTPSISLVGVTPGTVLLEFDSSWRDEDFQDAGLTVSYDGGEKEQVFLWESEPDSPFFKDDAENEHVQIPLINPTGATDMVLEFGVFNAGNDWWWAIDNVKITSSDTELALKLVVNTTTGSAAIENNTANGVDINFYQVLSETNSLNPAGWNSLHDQNLDAIGNEPGQSWDEGGGSDNSELVEAFLEGSSSLSAGNTLSLGCAFDTTISGQDLRFVYGLADGSLASGVLQYVSGGVTCDVTGDGACDVADMDAVVSQDVDVNGDGTFDQADIDAWLAEAATANGFNEPFRPGDANLDGTVNAGDLNAVGVNWQQTDKVWSQGDFNGDGQVNAQDLNSLGVNWQSDIGAAAPAAVPEPAAVSLFISACALAFATTRRRKG